MATVGFKDLHAATISGEGRNETYGKPWFLAKAIKGDLTVETAEGEIRADDGVDIMEKEFDKGTIKLNVSDVEPAKLAWLLG